MKTKKILSASLAAAMLLSYAPTAYAADPIVVIDPLGTVYEMGEDNTLEITDGIIGHGESFYLMLVDELTGMPSDIKSDDLRSLRVYADWEVGESRVSGEEILYRKAEDVLVPSTTQPDRYSLRVELNFGKGAEGITKPDGTGYTLDEIANLTDAQKEEILASAIAKYKASFADTTSYYSNIMGFITDPAYEHEYITNGYTANNLVYKNTAELSAAGIHYINNGYSYTDAGTTYYFTGEAGVNQYLYDKWDNYEIQKDPDFEYNNKYYEDSAGVKEALLDTDIWGSLNNVPSYLAYTNDSGTSHYYLPIIARANTSDFVSGSGIKYIEASDLTFDGEYKYYFGGLSADGYGEILISEVAPTNPTFTVMSPPTTGYILKNGDNYAFFERLSDMNNDAFPHGGTTTFKNTPATGPNAVYQNSDNLILNGEDVVQADYRTSYDGYYTRDGDAIGISDFTPASFYSSVPESDTSTLTSSAILNNVSSYTGWRKIDTKATSSEAEVATAVANFESGMGLITESLQADTLMPQATTRSLVATLSGSDYYYFVEVETKDYTGADSYDVVGFVSVGKSTSDAEDRGNAAVAITLSAGDYDNGTPQDNDIEIEGESGAVVEFEDNAGEIYIHWNDEAMFIVNVSGQGDLNLGYNTDFDSEFADRHGYANIDFLNFVAQPRFNRNGEFYLYASEDAYIYVLDEDGLPREISGLDYDEDEEAWTFRTNQLTSYVISDEELVLTDADGNIEEPDDATPETQAPVIGKPNPGTGR